MPTVAPSKVGTIIDALVALCRASATFADPVRVYDGPDVTDAVWTSAVFIGFDGDWAGNFASATVAQQWAYSGNTSRDEDIQIHGAAVAWSGDITPKTNRDKALTLLAGVETVIRTDPTLGIDNSVIAQLDVADMFQEPFRDGHACRILFTVRVHDQVLTT